VLFQDGLYSGGELGKADAPNMRPDNPAVPIKEHSDRQSTDPEQSCCAVVPSDRKGNAVGFRELLYFPITALDKDGGEANASLAISLIGSLKIGGLPSALRSPVGADVYYHRSACTSFVRKGLAVSCLEGKLFDRIRGVSICGKEDH